MPLLHGDIQGQKLIKDHVANNAIEEEGVEGVEVVPYLQCEKNVPDRDDDTDHVSVLYLKGSNKTMRDID